MSYRKKAFPYPVLGRSDDFPNASFNCDYIVQLDSDSATGNLLIQYLFEVEHAELAEKLEANDFLFSFDIYSKASFFRESLAGAVGGGSVSIPLHRLAGEVTVTPMIYAAKHVAKYLPNAVNPEFGSEEFELLPGDVVAIGETRSVFIGYDRQAKKSIVRVQHREDLPPYSYQFEFRADQIVIFMGTKANEVWSAKYSDSGTRPYLVMSVLKDCLLMALEHLAKSEDEDESSYWALQLREKLATKGVALDPDTPLEKLNLLAQELVEEIGIAKIRKDGIA